MNWLKQTHGVPFELTRHFLARMLDGEWSTERGAWQRFATGAFALFLPAGMLLIREGSVDSSFAFKLRAAADAASPEPFRAAALADQLALEVLLAVVTGLIALLVWQSLFPGRRDYLALAGLPVRPRQVFTARFSAVLIFSGALIAAVNLLPAFVAPVEAGGRWQKNPSFAANVFAQGAASGLECFFVFFAIVALQGCLLNLVPSRWFARVSTQVQGLLFFVLFFAGLRGWSIQNWSAADVARLPRFAWAPPVWFAGLHERLVGDRDPFFAAMAARALAACVAAFALAALTYLVSYRRYRTLLLEAPDAMPRARRRWSLFALLARSPRERAVMEFMATTLARSRAHRLIWLAYLGGAAALLVNSSIVDGALLARSGGVQKALRFLVLFWPLATTAVLLPGIRHVMRVPCELSANWIFRITETQGRAEWARAVERFVMLYALAPVYLLLAPAAVWAIGWPVALRMTVLQVMVSLIAFDMLFYSWQQLPFACSYVPARRPLVEILAGYLVLLGIVVPMLTYLIATAAQFPPLFVIYLAGLGLGLRKSRRLRLEGWGEASLRYEDTSAELTDLGIHEVSYGGTLVITPSETPARALLDAPPARPPLSVRLEIFWQDVRYALRQLRLSPGYSAAAACTLALGIGATTAIFSMFDAVLWRPVALRHPERLVFVLQALPSNPHWYSAAAPGDIDDIRAASASFDDLASWRIGQMNLVDSAGDALRANYAAVSANLFDLLEAHPAIGRRFLPGEDYPGSEHVVILSDDLWRNHFAADPAILGRLVRLDDRSFTVVGVMPPDFGFPRFGKQFWIPLALTAEERRSHTALVLDSVGRLKPHRTLAQAAAEISALGPRLETAHPATNRGRRFVAWSFAHYMNGDYLPVFTAMLFGSSGFVLLIACVNVANLQLARGRRRRRELAVRTALGAPRTRLLRQMLTESVVLALAGASLGLALAWWGLILIKAGVPAEMRQYMPGWSSIGLSLHALVFTVVGAVASGIGSGLSPALRGSRAGPAEALKEDSGGLSTGRGRYRLRSLLVAVEVALALILLVGSGIMVRAFRSLSAGSAAIAPETLLTMRLSLTEGRYPEGRRTAEFYRELLDRLAALPGVTSVAVAGGLPYSRNAAHLPLSIEGRVLEPASRPDVQVESVSAAYFRTLGIPLRAGRFPDAAAARPDAPRVAVVSERLARSWWPGEIPVGGTIRLGANGEPLRIVAVAGDIPYSVMEREPGPVVYVPFEQAPQRAMDVAIRTAGPPALLAPAVRSLVRELDRELPVANLSPMPLLIRQEAFVFAYLAALMGTFGLLALALAAIGVYGVTACVVSEQTREIGIRMALGAPEASVLGTLFRRGISTVAAGFALGALPSWALARFMRFAVWGVGSGAPPELLLIPLVLAASSALAIYFPARRAFRIGPAGALRL